MDTEKRNSEGQGRGSRGSEQSFQNKKGSGRRLLRVSWTVRRSNQSILKEINPDYILEGLMAEAKLQYFGHLIQRANSLDKTLMLGKIEGRRKSG